MPSKAVILVGVTGGIGSGKSVVCAEFEKLRRPVLYADVIAREIGDHDPEARKEIMAAFGPQAYGADGLLDRRTMAEKVFHSPEQLDRLNAIIHPKVALAMERTIGAMTKEVREPYVVVEAALVFESGMDEWLDLVIVVAADDETRIARTMARDGMDREAVKRRMASQIPQSKKESTADFIIRNDGEISSLAGKVGFLDRVLRSMAVNTAKQ